MTSVFKCRQFSVEHGDGVFKVNTDALLLAIYAPLVKGNVLDVGMGSGFVSLAYAQRALCAHVWGIDVHENSVIIASRNFASSPWSNRLHVSLEDVQSFKADFDFDLVLTNPPYHLDNYGAKDADISRAKHVNDLTPEKLAERIDLLLSPIGMSSVVGSLDYIERFANKMKNLGFYINKKIYLKGKVNKPAKRVILTVQRHSTIERSEDLVLYNEDNSYTQDYIDLVSEYLYLK